MPSEQQTRAGRTTRLEVRAQVGTAVCVVAFAFSAACATSPDAPRKRRAEATARAPAPAARPEATANGAAPEATAALAGRPTIVASAAERARGPAASSDAPRVYAKTRFVWIRERPEWASQWIGYLWPGESVKLARTKPIYARGCEAWYAVEPRGFVCVDDRRATLHADDPELVEIQRVPIAGSPASHRYAESLGAQVYDHLPDRAEETAREPDLARHLSSIDAARHGGAVDPTLAGIDVALAPREATPFTKLPIDIQVPRNSLRQKSTIAFLDEFSHDGRSFLLTPDLAWVPKDRVRPYDSVTFEGAHLDRGVRMPLAFFRERERPAYQRGGDGHFALSARKFARLAWVELSGVTEIDGGVRYLETREPGLWVLESDAVVPEVAPTTPWGERTSVVADAASAPAERKTWIEASVYGGWLIAYEDTRPVFVTLTAAGRGGAKPLSSKRLVTSSSTPLGTFPITGKFVTSTMDGPDEIVHADVPWVQNFRSAHAIHAAYWHDAFGELVSDGCLNVSPADGRFLFGFTEPPVPEGWHGVRWDPHLGPTTMVVVHR
ncbi:MAG TPA: L,D-transpeptidase [Polyangiaceae bacterium]|nr:L,D-transpeptidase [Polyangiaceae bacterium]